MKTKTLPMLVCGVCLAALTNSPAQTTFTKILINGDNYYGGAAWMDYDGNGYLDLIVANGVASAGAMNAVFLNNGSGSFSRVFSGPVPTDLGYSLSVACGDYDNDGLPDLFFGGVFGPTPTVESLLYRNTGNGNFERITGIGPITAPGNFTATWVDYDNDGFLNIFLANTDLANTDGANFLFRNQGDGTFAASGVVIPSHASGGNVANGAAWADYDNDRYPDVFIFGGSGPNLLLHNNHNGTFTQVHGTPFDTDAGPSSGAAWGDYDNDGFLDLFVVNGNFAGIQRRSYLYHNNGNGTFTKVTVGAIVTDNGYPVLAAWEDFDNDGNLDLFVSHNNEKNALYLNNGDGTFTSLTNSLLTADTGNFAGVSWGDYDNDGFPDLFVVAGQPSFLYRNGGNSNNWITFKLVGTVSNRSAIGAKVRVKATIHGKTYWQMRHVSNGDGLSGNSLNAHFGLGDATNAETVRIEWPSGTVQEIQNIAAKQILIMTEPSRLSLSMTNGISELTLRGGRNLQYNVQWSTNLTAWSQLSMPTITNLDGAALITDTNAFGLSRRFYRAMLH